MLSLCRVCDSATRLVVQKYGGVGFPLLLSSNSLQPSETVNDFLFTAEGEAYLREHYVRQRLSTHVIARDRGAYPNLVRRALQYHGIPRRTRTEAQRLAIESGRHHHPTRGRHHPQETRNRISEGVSKAWAKLTTAQRSARIRLAQAQWKALPEAQRSEFRRLGLSGLRRAAEEGSRLERFLATRLARHGYQVQCRTRISDQPVDILLPACRVAIQVDGPAHHLPVWGVSRLARVFQEDAVNTRRLLAQGLLLIRIKNLTRNLSEIQKRNLLTDILARLTSHIPGNACLHELEVQ